MASFSIFETIFWTSSGEIGGSIRLDGTYTLGGTFALDGGVPF